MLGQHFISVQKIKKPIWCPSDDAFIIIVTILYTLMGYASYLTLRRFATVMEEASMDQPRYL